VGSEPISHYHLTRVIGDVENKKVFTTVETRTHDHTHDRRSPYQQLNHRGWIVDVSDARRSESLVGNFKAKIGGIWHKTADGIPT